MLRYKQGVRAANFKVRTIWFSKEKKNLSTKINFTHFIGIRLIQYSADLFSLSLHKRNDNENDI